MRVRNPNKTYDLQSQAKNTLAFFSQFDEENQIEWNWQNQATMQKKKLYRLLDPIKKIKISRTRPTNSNSFYKTRTALVPCKISVENQPEESKKTLKTISTVRREHMPGTAKENNRTHKNFRNAYSLTRRAEQKQEEQGFDFMQYWVRHRFQDGAINTLVQKLKEKSSQTVTLRL